MSVDPATDERTRILALLDDADEMVAALIAPRPWTVPVEHYGHGATTAEKRKTGARARELKRNAARGTANEILKALRELIGQPSLGEPICPRCGNSPEDDEGSEYQMIKVHCRPSGS